MQLQPQRVGLLNALPHIKLKPNIQVNINFMCDTYEEPFSKNKYTFEHTFEKVD
jgi:hypothetical protein